MKIHRALGCVAAAFLFASAGLAHAQQAKTVTIGLSSSSFATAGLRLANELGIFAKHGINAKFIIADNSTVALAGLLANSFDLAQIGLPETFLALAHAQKIAVIDNTYGGFTATVVLSAAAAKKANVAPTAPINERYKALEGLLLAAPSPSTGPTLVLKNALQAQRVNVRWTYMAQSAFQAAMEAGSIDGYYGSAPFWAIPVVKGNGHAWISGFKNEIPNAPGVTGLLITTRAYADANAPLFATIRAVVADLGKAIEQRPQDVKQALAKLYPDITGPVIDLVFEAEAVSWSAKRLTVADLGREIKLVRDLGLDMPPLIDSIDPATVLIP